MKIIPKLSLLPLLILSTGSKMTFRSSPMLMDNYISDVFFGKHNHLSDRITLPYAENNLMIKNSCHTKRSLSVSCLSAQCHKTLLYQKN